LRGKKRGTEKISLNENKQKLERRRKNGSPRSFGGDTTSEKGALEEKNKLNHCRRMKRGTKCRKGFNTKTPDERKAMGRVTETSKRKKKKKGDGVATHTIAQDTSLMKAV